MLASEAEVMGRDRELGRIDAVLDSVGIPPNVVLMDGPAGAGKTTLLRAAVRLAGARGYRVLACSAAEAEARLSFVGLRDLLDGVFDEAATLLPFPQRRALAVALLREEPGDQPARSGAVAAAVLTVLRKLSSQQPVVVAVDDFPWLDRSTTSVLGFALRRLNGRSVCAVFTRRCVTPGEVAIGVDLQGMDLLQVPLGPLSLGAVQALLRDRHGLVLPRPTMRRLYEASGGNPFYALAIAQQIAEGHRSIGHGEPLAVPDDVHLLVIERIGRLSSGARAVLPVVASLARPTMTTVVAALGGETAVGEGLQEAIDAGVLRSYGDRLEFMHPLFAAAVYSRLPHPDRRRLHQRLANVTLDVEERAHHLARAADGPSGELAAALDLAAEAALARGAPAAAAEFADEATRATSPDDAAALQARRATAAEHHFEAGDTDLAVLRLEQAMAEETSRRTWAAAAAQLGRILLFRDDLTQSAELFRTVRDERRADPAVRLEAEEGLAWSLLLAREDLTEAAEQARRAVRAGRRWQNDTVLAEALAVSGLAELLLGRTNGVGHIGAAVDLAAQRRYSRVMRHPRWASAIRRVWTDDLAAARAELLALQQEIVDVGDESSLPRVLLALSHVHLLQGDWDRAASRAREGGEAAAESGQEPQAGMLLWTAGMIDAHLGQLDDARRAAQQRLDGGVVAAMSNRWTLGFCALSSGEYEQAYDHLSLLAARHDAAGVREPGALRFVPDLIEASIHLGRLAEAKWRLERYLALADNSGRVSAQLLAARCSGLLLAAEGKSEAAITALEAVAMNPQASLLPFEHARTRLALGTALRRAKRRAEARQTIAAAVAAFDRLGASAWSERASTELRRIGGRAPTPWELTPAEERIASLVATGRSNREVAAELFVTVKTVETTLTRVYRKLGLTSRAALVRTFATREPSERKV